VVSAAFDGLNLTIEHPTFLIGIARLIEGEAVINAGTTMKLIVVNVGPSPTAGATQFPDGHSIPKDAVKSPSSIDLDHPSIEVGRHQTFSKVA
jgi:hypothetical protein